jgi:hypothetical protein
MCTQWYSPLDTELFSASFGLIEALPQSAQDPHNVGWTPLSVLNSPGGEKELAMSLTIFIDDPCPRCRRPVKPVVIEPHPSYRDLAIHNYHSSIAAS